MPSNKENNFGLLEFKKVLNYNSKIGKFIRRIPINQFKVGGIAGSINNKGYIKIKVCGKNVAASHLAWLYAYGGWPSKQIDHINGDKADNRICNLREATNLENCRNRGNLKSNISGYKGVGFRTRAGMYEVRASFGGKRVYLGSFKTVEEGAAAYSKFASANYGEFLHSSLKIKE